ncbi:MAG: hypothetical protein E7665_07890 [Ruminococcaceae bacterium]|nr:hypothetical protein [Oscillospiraceae bacterium]
MKRVFSAGAAREKITPEPGVLLYGYNPHQVSHSVNDDLNVTALAIAEDDAVVLMLTADNGDMGNELSMDFRKRLSAECGVGVSNILISCTHTHSAPNLSGIKGWGDIDYDYYENIFLPSAITAAKRALEELKPAEIAVGVTQSRVGINRRQQYRDGTIYFGQNPHGCFDPDMTLVAIRETESGKGILNMIHYGCHGTAAGCNREITRDWSGVMVDIVARETGVLTAFWNGAIGDIGPRVTNGKTGGGGNVTYVNELGAVAGFDAMEAYKNLGGYHAGKLEIFNDTMRIPRREIPPLEWVKEKLSTYKDPEKLVNIQGLEYAHYKEIEEYYEKGLTIEKDYTFDQTLVSLGDVLFIPFPFEMFTEMTLRLKEYINKPHVLCLSCTNGYNVYLPTQDQICRGGYEVACFLYQHVASTVDNSDQYIINENIRILNRK